MIIDSSALIAILLGEPEAELFALAIARAPRFSSPPALLQLHSCSNLSALQALEPQWGGGYENSGTIEIPG